MGIAVPTMHARVRRLRAAGHKIPALTPQAARAVVASPTAELKEANQRIRELLDDRARARAVKPIPRPRPKVRRSEKEDRTIVIWPDLHGAKQDPAAVAAFLGDVKRLQPDRGVSLGDLVDVGGFLGAHHVLGHVAETAETYEEDIAAGNAFMDAVQAAAAFPDGLDWISGNHEHRVERWAVTTALRSQRDAGFLLGRVAPEVLMRAKERGVRYYRRGETYDGMPVQGAFRIGKLGLFHGLLNGNSTPDQVLTKFGMNTVFGHTHRVAARVRRTAAGTIGSWNIGTLSKLQQLYAHGAPTDHCHGYAICDMARSGAFQMTQVLIVDGVSLLKR